MNYEGFWIAMVLLASLTLFKDEIRVALDPAGCTRTTIEESK